MTDKKKSKDKGTKESMDSMDELPLSIIPLSSNTFKNAKLLKNTRMETVLELYNDPITGSFQMATDDDAFADAFSSHNEAVLKDQEIIQKLSKLKSFDIYSLRVTLRKMGLDVVDEKALELSSDMKNRLKKYTRSFTTPLIQKIYGDDESDALKSGDLTALFKNSDIYVVKKNLDLLSEKTGIKLGDLPKFLENYSDVFLSIAYYRYSYEQIDTEVQRLLVWINDIEQSPQIKKTPATYHACLEVADALHIVLSSLKDRFDRFQFSFELFWTDINHVSFETLQKEIQRNHASMGAVLCGLHVKLNAWKKEFPNNDIGSPQKRGKFIISDLQPGIQNLKVLEETARAGLGFSELPSDI